MATGDKETTITIKATATGTADVLSFLSAIQQQMALNVAATEKATQAQSAYIAEIQKAASVATPNAEAGPNGANFNPSYPTLASQTAGVQFTADMETQKLRELTSAQTEAIGVNNQLSDAEERQYTNEMNISRALELNSESNSKNNISMVELAATYYLVSQAINVVMGAITDLFQAAQEGAGFQRLIDSGGQLAATFGVSLPEAVNKLKAASLDTITAQQAMILTNKALLVGAVTNVDQLASLMGIVAVTSRGLGQTTEQALTQAMMGIANLSTRVLAGVGIVVNAQLAYSDYATSINKVASELTGEERRQALVNAIISDYTTKLGTANTLTDDAAAKFARFQTDAADVANVLKADLAPALADVANALDILLLGEYKLEGVVTQHAQGVESTSKSYAQYKVELERAAAAAGMVIATNGDLVTGAEVLGGSLNGLVQKNYLLSAFEYEAAKAAAALAASLKQTADNAAANVAWYQKLSDALVSMNDAFDKATTTSSKFSLQDAGKYAVSFEQALGVVGDQLTQLRLGLGLTDQGMIDFENAMKAAGAQGAISARQVQEAWAKFIEPGQLVALTDTLNAALAQSQTKYQDALSKLGDDTRNQYTQEALAFSRKKEDIATQDARKLEDLAVESQDKTQALATTHARKLEDIEIQHQQQIASIMQRYELSKLKALIDLDGRALFEAQAQRDADLSKANTDAQTKKAAENTNYQQSLDDLKTYLEQQKEKIATDTQRALDDAKKADQQRRDDINAANTQKLQDIVTQHNAEDTLAGTNYAADKAKLDAQLTLIQTAKQKSYDAQVGDMLIFFKTNQNMLTGLQNGTTSIDALLNLWNQNPTIPFGGVAWTPPKTDPHPCPTGCHWDGSQCRNNSDNNPCSGGVGAPSNTSAPSSSSSTNLKVTLNVTGDGLLAAAVRASALAAVWDVIS